MICIAIVDETAFLCLRLTFDTTPAPAEYTTVSEAEIDLGNDLLQNEYWDTDNINSPRLSLLPHEDKQQPESHIATSDLLSVDITATEALIIGFIDDTINITVDDNIG